MKLRIADQKILIASILYGLALAHLWIFYRLVACDPYEFGDPATSCLGKLGEFVNHSSLTPVFTSLDFPTILTAFSFIIFWFAKPTDLALTGRWFTAALLLGFIVFAFGGGFLMLGLVPVLLLLALVGSVLTIAKIKR